MIDLLIFLLILVLFFALLFLLFYAFDSAMNVISTIPDDQWHECSIWEWLCTKYIFNHYLVEITTEYGEKETLNITAVKGDDVEDEERNLVANYNIGLKGTQCVELEVFDKD